MADHGTLARPSPESRALARALRAFIARRVQDPADLSRVLHDTLVHMKQELAGLRKGQRVGACLYHVARSRVAEHNKRQSAGALLFDAAAAPPPDDEEQVREELAVLMEACVDSLPDTYREALLLSELEDLPQPEVAERLGLSLASAKARIERGQQRLQDLLEGCCTRELAAAR